MNVKERLAATVAARRGWAVVRQVSLLAVADTSANREIVRGHPTLFAGFVRHRLTRAAFEAAQGRLLTWISHREASRPAWIAGRQRVRRETRRQISRGDQYPKTVGRTDGLPAPISQEVRVGELEADSAAVSRTS